jgi:hypothetical protein
MHLLPLRDFVIVEDVTLGIHNARDRHEWDLEPIVRKGGVDLCHVNRTHFGTAERETQAEQLPRVCSP